MSSQANDLKRAIEILNLTPPFSLLDIKNAYKYQAKQLHPDRLVNDTEKGDSMKRLNWAYHLLLSHFEQVKIPLSILIDSTRSEEERIQARFYYDWMPKNFEEKDAP